jgi:hypothetical protein
VITVIGSYGEVFVDEDGNVTGGSVDGVLAEVPPEYADIIKFDLRRYSEDGPLPTAIDILCVGYWVVGGAYSAPEVNCDEDVEALNEIAEEWKK